MEIVLKGESRRLNFHGQPGRVVHMRCGDASFLFRMTMRDLLFMYEDSSKETILTDADMNDERTIDQAGNPASSAITLEQGDTIRLGREPQFSRDGQRYHIGVEDIVGRLDVARTRRLAGPVVQSLIRQDAHISRNHMAVDVMAPDIVMVNDLGSTNGTYLQYKGL